MYSFKDASFTGGKFSQASNDLWCKFICFEMRLSSFCRCEDMRCCLVLRMGDSVSFKDIAPVGCQPVPDVISSTCRVRPSKVVDGRNNCNFLHVEGRYRFHVNGTSIRYPSVIFDCLSNRSITGFHKCKYPPVGIGDGKFSIAVPWKHVTRLAELSTVHPTADRETFRREIRSKPFTCNVSLCFDRSIEHRTLRCFMEVYLLDFFFSNSF